MKNNYEKYIKEAWVMKDKVFIDYEKSKHTNYRDFVNEELKKINFKFPVKSKR